MNDNTFVIAALCSHMGSEEPEKPLEPKVWRALEAVLLEQDLQPADLLHFRKPELMERLNADEAQAERLLRLLDRAAGLSFTLSRYETMGIRLLTGWDAQYPARLKQKLGSSCPPLFYAAGSIELLEKQAVGYVGSRSIGETDEAFTKQTVQKTVGFGYGVVSGGAKGIDTVAETAALEAGGTAVAFLADSMLRKLKHAKTIQAVQEGRLLLLSSVNPEAGFSAGIAMMRNRYIYAQSDATVVVKSDYNKGGTWAGAVDNLKHHWAATLCRDHKAYPGNKALLEQGAIPIDSNWDGDVTRLLDEKQAEHGEQLSLFD